MNSFMKELLGWEAMLCGYANYLTANTDEAQDLCQETFYRALLHADKYTGEGPGMKFWLRRIMCNIFLNDRKRKVNRELSLEEDVYDLPNLQTPETDMVISDFEQALQELTNEKRDVFIAYLQGYSYQEIADRFQIPIGTGRSRISAARHQLDDRLSR